MRRCNVLYVHRVSTFPMFVIMRRRRSGLSVFLYSSLSVLSRIGHWGLLQDRTYLEATLPFDCATSVRRVIAAATPWRSFNDLMLALCITFPHICHIAPTSCFSGELQKSWTKYREIRCVQTQKYIFVSECDGDSVKTAVYHMFEGLKA